VSKRTKMKTVFFKFFILKIVVSILILFWVFHCMKYFINSVQVAARHTQAIGSRQR